MRTTAALDARLAAAGYRLTGPRRTLASVVAERDGHFTAAELMADPRVGDHGIGRATVFRSLDALAAVGAVERIDLPSGEHAYIRCDPAHHHHVVCRSCGQAANVDDAGLRAVAAEIERRTGYEIDGHRLELFGLCRTCRGGPA
ncbi:MAG TPA: Fur family transcriptional regulator [Candidatus Limnocylindrales bacterium]|nr:Fur family transcriptional regulator [Candidatus Limnocylindrales bacterium]